MYFQNIRPNFNKKYCTRNRRMPQRAYSSRCCGNLLSLHAEFSHALRSGGPILAVVPQPLKDILNAK